MDGELSFRVLGPLEVWRNGEPLRLGAAKQRALLGLLLIRRGEVSRDVLVDALWGEQPPTGARNTLQVYVSSLRKALGRELIETTADGYRLRLEPGAVDAERFEDLFREGRELLAADDAGAAHGLLSEGLGLWRGPAHADLSYEAFAQAEAGRLEELRVACLEERIEADLQLGRHTSVVGELEALVVEHPLRERLRGQLILALYRSGRQSEALAQYQAARRVLSEELGLEPSPELRELERLILAHDPGLAAPPSPAKPLSNLPLQPTPFIGRERELADLLELIRGGGRRLVTLTGPGGSGKTRLAIEAAAELAPDFEDGVWWVPLQSLVDPQLVQPAIADAVDAKGDLARHIGSRRMLVVIDNFEHLLDAAPEAGALLTRCPALVVLTTSREPLHLAAEREYEVAPMLERDAVALFDERATQHAPDEIAVEICRRLDCLPLAVELAAARTKAFTPTEVLDRLDERLSFLTGGARDAPGRHQTLRAAIDWSYELLGREERSVFVKLSVFAGGCTADAAAVCEATEDDLQDLVDKSLLVHSEGRYTMLETIREFARDLLQASGEADAACAAHADWYFTLAREFQAEAPNAVQLDEATWASWRPRLDAELDNLRTAFDWLVGCGRREEGFELALALLVFWARGGHFQAEEVRWLKKGFVATGPITEATRGDALHFLGLSQFLGGGTPAECESPLLEALEIRRALAEPERIAATLRALSFVALEQGAFERARALWAELVALELGDPKWTYMENELLGEIELAAGNLDEALEYNERALAEARDLDLIRMVPDLLHVVGDVHLLRRSLDEAEGHYREGLALAWRSGFDRPVYECLGGLAAVAFWSGAMRRAGRLWGVVERASFLRPSFHERYERTLANCTDPPFLEGLADAERLSLEEATAYALSVEHDSWS